MDRTYCVFGDSVTQGAYIKNCWVDLLRIYLEKKYSEDVVNVFNLGIGGNTSEDILLRFAPECQARNPTHIIIAVGINDSGYLESSNIPITTDARFLDNMTYLAKAGKWKYKEVIFVGLVVGDVTGKSDAKKGVEKYDNLIKDVAVELGCGYIPLLEKLGNEDFLDGLHPNQSGHRKMVNEIEKLV